MEIFFIIASLTLRIIISSSSILKNYLFERSNFDHAKELIFTSKYSNIEEGKLTGEKSPYIFILMLD